MSNPLLQVNGISKSYANLKVLDNITFALQRGEILGLVGRRGSGKSTLLHLMGGVTRASEGTIFLEERKIQFLTPDQAHRQGVELVPQVPHIVEQLNVLENIFLGREISRSRFVRFPDFRRMRALADTYLQTFDLDPDFLNASVKDLTNEQRQLIVLMRAFVQSPKLLLLDDVLSTLNFRRQEILLEYVQQKAAEGLGAIICSEDIKHLFAITDRILVLYDGKLVADWSTADCTPRDVVESIVGSSHREQVTPVIWALENYHKAQQQTDELFRQQTQLHASLEVSDTLNRQLVEKLSEQVKAMDRLNLALQETQRRLLTEREEERKALARELHDSVIQDLLSINYRLEDVESEKSSTGHREELNDIRNAIRDVVSDLRQVCRDLRPPTIDNHGLSSAIPSLVREWEARTGIAVYLEIDSTLGRLPELIEFSVFRIVQEALNNVSKHAQAQNVRLLLQRTPGDSLSISVSDDGHGFLGPVDLAELSAQKHFGLIGISERVALLGGNMHIESSQEKGLTLQVEIPFP